MQSYTICQLDEKWISSKPEHKKPIKLEEATYMKENPDDPRYGSDCYMYNTRAKQTTDNGSLKLKIFCSQKAVSVNKDKHLDWEKYLKRHNADKGLLLKLYKNSQNSTIRQ